MNRKFFLQLCATFILLMACISTAFAAETWVTDPKTGAKIGWSSSDWTLTAASWSGPLVGGKAEGKGELDATIRYKDGTTVHMKGEVEMIAGLLDGKVTIKYSDGDLFEGNYKQGFRTGPGIYRFKDGNYYEGDYKYGKYDGQGIFRFNSGAYYEGSWKNGAYNGKGILKYEDGRIYEGDFVNNLPEGFGVGKDATGKVIHDGQWKGGMPYEALKADKVLGIPWGASEADAKKILLQRPKMAGPFSFMSGKDGQITWKGYSGAYADYADAWIYVYFYQDKMWQVRISWPLKADQVMNRFDAMKQGLTARYGKPYVEKGKFLDTYLAWALGNNHFVDLEIRKNTTKLTPADPTPQTHPFRVGVAYYNSNVAKELGLIKSPGGGAHKDF